MNSEWLGFWAIVGAVLWLLLRSRSSGLLTCISLLVLVLLAATSAWGWRSWSTRRELSRRELAQRIPTQGRPGGYVSSDKCQACHPGQYQTWHRTFHRTMTQVASPQAVLGRFDHVALELNGKKFLLEQRGNEYWAEMDDPELDGDVSGGRGAPARVWKRIGLLTGSHHMQVYWIPASRGNMQMIFPFAWLNEDRRWVPFYQTFLRDPAKPPSLHIWNVNCLKCHSTGGQPREDQQTHMMSTRTGELGIACEACHGPGEKHVNSNQNPVHRYFSHSVRQTDVSIVNPKRLSPRLSSEVCGQCHGIKWIPNKENWREEGFSFRPGDELDDSTPLVRPAKLESQPWLQEPLNDNKTFLEEHYWPDGMVRVSGRDFNGMIESPCHQRGSLSCLSCHSLHESDPTNQLAAGMETNEACLQCHTQMRGNVQAHSHHPADSSGSLCYNCHMPRTVYGLLKSIRSHHIDNPNIQSTVSTGRPIACNLCHLDRSLGWTAKYLSEWYNQPVAALTEEHQTISAAVVWALKGDAGQRALIADSMGWTTAQKASGDRWMVPFLGILMDDSYAAVRYIAHRSLRSLPGDFKTVPYDFIAPPKELRQAAQQVLELWSKDATNRPSHFDPWVLILTDGRMDKLRIRNLLQARNNRSMDLQE